MNEVNKKMPVHNIILEGRRKLSVSGVTDVDRFDENTVLLYTSMGELTVCGSGEMNIEGEIRSIVYGDPDRHSPLSFLGRIFR